MIDHVQPLSPFAPCLTDAQRNTCAVIIIFDRLVLCIGASLSPRLPTMPSRAIYNAPPAKNPGKSAMISSWLYKVPPNWAAMPARAKELRCISHGEQKRPDRIYSKIDIAYHRPTRSSKTLVRAYVLAYIRMS